MSTSARSSIEQNMEDSQIQAFAKKYSCDEQNQIHTSETCSSNNSPNNSCYSQGDQAKSIFNIEEYLISTNKNQVTKDDFSSALAATLASEQSGVNEQMSFSSFPLNTLHSIFSSSQYDDNSVARISDTPATKKSSSKKPLARKSVFLEDHFHEKIEKKIKGSEICDAAKPLHEEVEFHTNDGSKTFKFNCFPESFLRIPDEFQDKNINHNSDNDAESSDETIQNACRYNLRKIKLELMELSTTFRYSHYHVDFDIVSQQYTQKSSNRESEQQSVSLSNSEKMTQQNLEQQSQKEDQTIKLDCLANEQQETTEVQAQQEQ